MESYSLRTRMGDNLIGGDLIPQDLLSRAYNGTERLVLSGDPKLATDILMFINVIKCRYDTDIARDPIVDEIFDGTREAIAIDLWISSTVSVKRARLYMYNDLSESNMPLGTIIHIDPPCCVNQDEYDGTICGITHEWGESLDIDPEDNPVLRLTDDLGLYLD